MLVYQLLAVGNLANSLDGSPVKHSIRSRKVYSDWQQAKDACLDFLKKCTSPESELDYWYLDATGTTVRITTLELVEPPAK